MDIEKLIVSLRSPSWQDLEDPDAPLLEDAAHALSTLQAENERLKNKLSELAHFPFDEPGIGERTRLMAENAELRAELEQVKRALAMMWFSCVNSDKEMPHSYETEALEEAERILGPWAECMPKYLKRGPKEG